MTRRSFLAGLTALAGLALLPATPKPAPKMYTAGKGGGFASMQEAADAMWTDQGSLTFSADYPDIGAWPS